MYYGAYGFVSRFVFLLTWVRFLTLRMCLYLLLGDVQKIWMKTSGNSTKQKRLINTAGIEIIIESYVALTPVREDTKRVQGLSLTIRYPMKKLFKAPSCLRRLKQDSYQ